jgi:hypothetical protein
MPDARKDHLRPRFDAGTGQVETLMTVKEGVERLLAEGFFDKATACLIVASSDSDVALRQQGRPWEVMALSAFAFNKIGKD